MRAWSYDLRLGEVEESEPLLDWHLSYTFKRKLVQKRVIQIGDSSEIIAVKQNLETALDVPIRLSVEIAGE